MSNHFAKEFAWVTKLLVKREHKKGHHVAGVSHTFAELSTRFWIPSGREVIREWEQQCAMCQRKKAKPSGQIMAPLPSVRVCLPLRAFARVAVDYAGPFITIQDRGKRRMKHYLCLFTRLTSRAVHLEMAYSLRFFQGIREVFMLDVESKITE